MLTAIAQEQPSRNGRAASGRIAQIGVRRDMEDARSRVADRGQPVLDWLDGQLLDACRRDFPICEKPFTEIARRLDCRAHEVLRHIRELERRGVIKRIGPVLAPESVGANALVAMAVPTARLHSIAEAVIAYRGVHQLCERQHEFNLWFALTAPNAGELYDTVTDIRWRTGVEVLDLRPERRYCGDLEVLPWGQTPTERCGTATRRYAPGRCPPLDASDDRLLAVASEGLSLTARPYAVVANRIGISEAQVIERLKHLLRGRVIERMGVVERHRPPDPAANALVVFDVPRYRVDIVGERLAQLAWVNECFRCMQRASKWPYNLYCTLRDGDLAKLIGCVDEQALVRCPQRAVLPSRASRSAAREAGWIMSGRDSEGNGGRIRGKLDCRWAGEA